MRNTCHALAFFALAFWLGAAAQENSPEPTPKPSKLFESDATLAISLHGPWRRILRDVTDPQRYDGSLEFTDTAGQRQTISVQIGTRGLTRLEQVCDFPPLKLWFDKQQRKGTAFRGQGSLKMVTHCFTSKRYESYYVKEFLGYRIYNLISPYSFRVRALEVTYHDSERDARPFTRFAFLIEDIDDVAKRNDLVKLEVPEIHYTRLHPAQTSNYMLYQYLIGNLDWSVLSSRDPEECCHNTKLVGSDTGTGSIYPVPYDLDSTGLVDAHYAGPPDNLPVRDIRQRLFRGFCLHNSEVPPAIERYLAQRNDIVALFQNEPRLDNRTRGDALRYIEDFYRELRRSDAAERLTRTCRGRAPAAAAD